MAVLSEDSRVGAEPRTEVHGWILTVTFSSAGDDRPCGRCRQDVRKAASEVKSASDADRKRPPCPCLTAYYTTAGFPSFFGLGSHARHRSRVSSSGCPNQAREPVPYVALLTELPPTQTDQPAGLRPKPTILLYNMQSTTAPLTRSVRNAPG